MNTNVLLILQTVLIFSQAIDAGLTGLTQNQHVLIAAGIGAIQFLVQHIGNQTGPSK
jgi:hypothetical protein